MLSSFSLTPLSVCHTEAAAEVQGRGLFTLLSIFWYNALPIGKAQQMPV